jgi:hypothetical protein
VPAVSAFLRRHACLVTCAVPCLFGLVSVWFIHPVQWLAILWMVSSLVWAGAADISRGTAAMLQDQCHKWWSCYMEELIKR